MSFEERMELTASGNKDWQYLQAALIMVERNKGTILDGFRGLIIEAGMSELKNIQKYGACYFNCVGGHTFGVEYDMFCRIKEQFSTALESKDKTIQDLQAQIMRLKDEKDAAEQMATGAVETAAQSMKETAAATERAESVSQLVAEKDRTIGTLAEKLAAAEAKSEGYDALEQEKKESQEQIRTLQLTIEEQKKDHAVEIKDLQRDMERKLSVHGKMLNWK